MADETQDTLALARRYVDIDRYQPALDALARAGGEELADPEYWLVRTAALRGLDRADEAVAAARHGLELASEDISLLDSLALAELDRDDVVSAEKALLAALEVDPENPTLHAHLALTLARAKRFNDAFVEIGRGMRIDPNDIGVLRVRAQVSFLAEEPSPQVREYVDELLRHAPGDRTGHALLGFLAARSKDYGLSARALREAARLDPSDHHLAHAARETTVLAHPVLAPVRAVWRFGRWRAYFVFLSLFILLAAIHQTTIRVIVGVLWLALVLLSRIGPRVLRWRAKRRYGG